MKIKRKCQSCGHEREFDACPLCEGNGQKLQDKVEHMGFSLIRCHACGGTGIKGGRVICTNQVERALEAVR